MSEGCKKILITGATGYVGRQLAARLLADGIKVRLMARNTSTLKQLFPDTATDIIHADANDERSLRAALEGISTAYYLIHSMSSGSDFIRLDYDAAAKFAKAAKAAGLERIIYLGGLGGSDAELSAHLHSRHEVGRILAQTGVPVTEFRGAVIVGAGSLSFEMIRYLTERIPVMICPRWVFTRIQPIAIEDVLAYLTAALDNPDSIGRVIEIGGADVLRYADLMRIYAQQRGLQRWIVRVGVLTPKLSSYWVHLVTPISSSVAIPLIEGLKNEVVVTQADAKTLFPEIAVSDYRHAVKSALQNIHPDSLDVTAKDVNPSRRWKWPRFCVHCQGMTIEAQRIYCHSSPEQVFTVLDRLGGSNGWLGLEWIWHLRGWVDRFFGGHTFKSRRPDRSWLEPDDIVDCFTVEKINRPNRLLLRVNYKLPGQGWLEFKILPTSKNQTQITCTIYFASKGLLGTLYWYSVLLPHRLVFSRLLKQIAAASITQQPPLAEQGKIG